LAKQWLPSLLDHGDERFSPSREEAFFHVGCFGEKPSVNKNVKGRIYRDAPDPLYSQLKDSLRADIIAGRYRPHEQLPSERELSNRFKVSRMTVRNALSELARDGTIYTRIGKGTYVSEPKIDQQLRTLTGFTQDVSARGGKPSSRVLEAKVIPATAEVGAALRITPGAEVILLSRLRFADGEPLAVETAYLPFALFPDLLNYNFAVDSLYNVLENKYGVNLTLAEQTIEAALAGSRELELLKLTPPSAVLRMRRLTLTSDGVAVEFVSSAYRADRYKFRSVLNTRNAPG
jgi:GntR family transcriptional regulator